MQYNCFFNKICKFCNNKKFVCLTRKSFVTESFFKGQPHHTHEIAYFRFILYLKYSWQNRICGDGPSI